MCVKCLSGFLSYGYLDGVALREDVALLREKGLLKVFLVGLAVVCAVVEEPLSLFLMETRKIELNFDLTELFLKNRLF